MNTLRAIICALILVTHAGAALSLETVYQSGDWVVVTVGNTQFEREGERFGRPQVGDSFNVGHQDGDWIWIPLVRGRLKKSEVVLHEKAYDYFTAKITESPYDPWRYVFRSMYFAKKRSYDKAIADADRAIELDPDSAGLYICRGNIYSRKGNATKAAADFEVAIRLDPSDINGWNGRGLSRHALMQYEGAIADYDHAINLEPNTSYLYSNRGNSSRQLKRYDAAIDDYTTAIRLAPEDPTPVKNRAEAYWIRGDHSKAFADYQAAIDLASSDIETYLMRGDRYTEIGFYSDALADYTKAIQISPTAGDGYVARSWLLSTCPDSRYRDVELALSDATIACALVKYNEPAALRVLASSLAEAGRFAEAVDWQKKALDLVSYRNEVRYKRFLARYQRNEPVRQASPIVRPAVEAPR